MAIIHIFIRAAMTVLLIRMWLSSTARIGQLNAVGWEWQYLGTIIVTLYALWAIWLRPYGPRAKAEHRRAPHKPQSDFSFSAPGQSEPGQGVYIPFRGTWDAKKDATDLHRDSSPEAAAALRARASLTPLNQVGGSDE